MYIATLFCALISLILFFREFFVSCCYLFNRITRSYLINWPEHYSLLSLSLNSRRIGKGSCY